MFEKAMKGNSAYWSWLAVLGVFIVIGVACYVRQFLYGMHLTGMGRDVAWGLYIAQFTFLVGVAAGGLMLVLPYYIHDYKEFGRITILGEFLAISALIMCLMFIMVDIGQPLRCLNMILHPTPNSMLFWDMCVLMGYLSLNIICGWVILTAEKKQVKPPKWVYIFVYISIPFAVSIHTVTAFLYAGLPGREFWLSAIVAPRFLASAFAAGPALVVLACLIMKRVANFDAGEKAINKVVTIIMYAALINAFFVCLEFFTAYYSNIPGHKEALNYLYYGLTEGGHVYDTLVPFMWASVAFCFIGLGAFGYMKIRKTYSEPLIAIGCVLTYVSLWIDKGAGFVFGGLAVSPLGDVNNYYPKANEIGIALGIYAVGFFVLTVLYKIAITVDKEVHH